MMIDIDHGDVTSPDKRDVDPYAWAEDFAARSPIIHVKQSSMNKGGHWPFTAAHRTAASRPRGCSTRCGAAAGPTTRSVSSSPFANASRPTTMWSR